MKLSLIYLYQEDNPNFELVHSEDDFFVSQVKDQNPGFDYDIVQFRGLRGPIRIWEINYPEEIELRQQVSSKYKDLLSSSLKFQLIPAGSKSVWAQFCPDDGSPV